jgi:lipopolysaccharide export system protein LptC
MLSPRQRLLAVIMAAIGVVAWWHQQKGETPRHSPPAGPRRPDYTVEKFTATMMNKKGLPQRQLAAPLLRHYADDGSSVLDDPVLTLFTQSGPPWVIRSRTGWVSQTGDRVVLRGNVRVDRVGTKELRPVHLRTAELHVHPREDFAETDTPVKIASDGDWITSSAGAQAWLHKTLRVKLLGRSQGMITAETARGGKSAGGEQREPAE